MRTVSRSCSAVKSRARTAQEAASGSRRCSAPLPKLRRGATLVRFAGDVPTDEDMSDIGLGDIFSLVDAAEVNAQAAWLPGSYAPDHLNGRDYPGDYGFDPLCLAAEGGRLMQFREAEVLHSRWAMLGVAGALAQEALGQGSWLDAPMWAVSGETPAYFGINLPLNLTGIAVIQFFAMYYAEKQRAAVEDAEGRMYPGGAFDPMGLANGDLEDLKLKELKHGRLAMLAALGFAAQGALLGESPISAWKAHIADPFGVNIGMVLFK